MSNTKVLSADVTAGHDPNYAEAYVKNNSVVIIFFCFVSILFI